MTLAATITAANGKFTGFKTAVNLLQAAHYADKGRYLQLLDSHSTFPVDEAVEVPDRFAIEVPDHPGESWSHNPGGSLNGLLTSVRNSMNGAGAPFSGSVRIYTTSAGDGYDVIGRLTHTGIVYIRIDSVGPRDRSTGGTFISTGLTPTGLAP